MENSWKTNLKLAKIVQTRGGFMQCAKKPAGKFVALNKSGLEARCQLLFVRVTSKWVRSEECIQVR